MASSSDSIFTRYPVEARLLLGALLLAVGSLMVGLFVPIITLTKFYVVDNTFSIVTGLLQLWNEGRVFLFVLILAFSVLMPILKLGVLFQLLRPGGSRGVALHRALHLMHQYGKWSMLDVFVVALLVVSVKLGAVASVETHYGLYAFAAAVLLTMVITARVIYLAGEMEMDV